MIDKFKKMLQGMPAHPLLQKQIDEAVELLESNAKNNESLFGIGPKMKKKEKNSKDERSPFGRNFKDLKNFKDFKGFKFMKKDK